jgi:hypothetical protein
MKSLLWGLLTLSAAFGTARAVEISSGVVTLSSYYAYSFYDGGDVAVLVNPPVTPGCEQGYWLSPTDPGFRAFATLVMAYVNKSPLTVFALNDSIWPGSAGRYCRVSALNPS